MLRYFTACHLLRPLGRDSARSRLFSASSQNSNASPDTSTGSAARDASADADATAADKTPNIIAAAPATTDLSRYSRDLVRQRPSTRTSAPVLRTKRIVVDDDDSWGPRCGDSARSNSFFHFLSISSGGAHFDTCIHFVSSSLLYPLRSPTALPVAAAAAAASNTAHPTGAVSSQQAPPIEIKAVSRAEVQNTIAEALEAARRNAEAAPSDPRLRHGKEKQGAVSPAMPSFLY